ncbi:MAG: CoA transferase [Tepidiformaceae bacterium]
MDAALNGLRVVEISRGMPGALAAMILADYGADVIRLEDPAGDPYLSEAGERLWSRGKTRVAVDMDDPAGRAQAAALAREADVVLVGLRPATAERWGLTYEALASDNPALVFASISGFGWDGPYRDQPITENLMYAISGGMTMEGNGGLRKGPVFIAPHSAACGAAFLAVQGILAALHERDGSGIGQHVDTSLYRAMLVYRAFYMWNPELRADEFPMFPPSTDPRGIRPLFNLNECADGEWLSMGAWTPALSHKALEVMGLTHILADKRFAGIPNVLPDLEARMAVLQILWDEFRKRPRQEWLDLMDAQGIPSEPVQSIARFRELDQLWANASAVRVDDPVVGPMIQQGVVGMMPATPGIARPAEATARPAGFIAEAAARWAQAAPVRGDGAMRPGGRGPLSGVRVLDLTAFLSGPMAVHLLTDLGADVVKVESPDGDDFRVSAPSAFRYLHRDKRGVVLDLKTPAGQAALDQLIVESDVVVYNYRLGVEERLGLTYDRLRALNPGVIVCRITAFGPHGKRAHRGGYDASITALSGMPFIQAGEGNPPVSIGMADISTGIAAATALAIAIRAKETSGVGQAIDVSMIGAMAYVGADAFPDYPGMPPGESLDGGQHGFSPLYRLYQTMDGWLMLSARPGQAETVRDALAIEFGAEMDAARLQARFATRTTADWVSLLHRRSVNCANPLVDAKAFLYQTPELKASGTAIGIDHPVYGVLGQAGPAVHFSRTPARVDRQDPELGEHDAEVFGRIVTKTAPGA